MSSKFPGLNIHEVISMNDKENETTQLKPEDVEKAKKKGSIFGDPVVVIDND